MVLTESPVYALTDWREIIKEIDVELEKNNSIARREGLLQMFKTTMDIAETTVAPERLETFRETRHQHYNSHILQEALVGGNVCVESLFSVTAREIEAGRMTEDNNLRKLAVDGCAFPHFTRAQLEENARAPKVEGKPGFIGRLKGLFGR